MNIQDDILSAIAFETCEQADVLATLEVIHNLTDLYVATEKELVAKGYTEAQAAVIIWDAIRASVWNSYTGMVEP